MPSLSLHSSSSTQTKLSLTFFHTISPPLLVLPEEAISNIFCSSSEALLKIWLMITFSLETVALDPVELDPVVLDPVELDPIDLDPVELDLSVLDSVGLDTVMLVLSLHLIFFSDVPASTLAFLLPHCFG